MPRVGPEQTVEHLVIFCNTTRENWSDAKGCGLTAPESKLQPGENHFMNLGCVYQMDLWKHSNPHHPSKPIRQNFPSHLSWNLARGKNEWISFLVVWVERDTGDTWQVKCACPASPVSQEPAVETRCFSQIVPSNYWVSPVYPGANTGTWSVHLCFTCAGKNTQWRSRD